MRKKLLTVLLLMPVIAITSCATLNTSNHPAEVKVQTIKPEMLLGDAVPVYPGFRFVSQKSFIYESGDVKVGRLVFTGNAKVKDIVSYYKDVLPQQGWEPIAVTIFGNQASLTYVTPDRTLQIEVSRGFSDTVLVIQVGPRGELTTKEE